MLESNDEIEWAMRDLARPGCNYIRVHFVFGHADRSFVRMGGKELEWRRSVHQQFMNWRDCVDLLIIAVAARVIVGPGDAFRILIISDMTRFIRVRMPGMEKMGAAYSAQSAKRRSQILMIASGQDSTASLTKTGDALAIRH